MIITMETLKNNAKHQNNFKPKTVYHGNITLLLDFDGVLHTLGVDEDFNRVHYIQTLLEKFPNVSIVISSSWGDNMTLPELKSLLPSIRNYIIGKTDDKFEKRSDAIKDWLGRCSFRRYYPWIAIDDSAFFDDDSPVIWCDPRTGLDDESYAALEAAITSPHEYKRHCADRWRE